MRSRTSCATVSGVAIGKHAYRAYRELLESDRFQKPRRRRGAPQRLLFASTGTKDPNASDVLYIEALAAPDTINTMPDKTLLAFADHGQVGDPIPPDGGDADEVLAQFTGRGHRHGRSSPPGFSGRARSPSTRAGTTSWNRSSRSPADWQPQGEQA